MKIKEIFKRLCPNNVWSRLSDAKLYALRSWVCGTWGIRCWNRIRRIRRKDVITVVFLPIDLSMWKHDFILKKMLEHPRFKPCIILNPVFSGSDEAVARSRENMRAYFAARDYPMVEYSDIDPNCVDLVFLSQWYKMFDCLGIEDFPNALACANPYGFPVTKCEEICNIIEAFNVWRYFDAIPEHKAELAEMMFNSARNVVVTGYLSSDYFLQKDVCFKFSWKQDNPDIKRIIYAPHWTIYDDRPLACATFMSMGEIMLKIAKKYAGKVQWCFKPHPWLFRELCKHPEWGAEKAQAYYDAWANLPNSTISTGDYIQLFMTSDALIHDSSSFKAEYFYARKPALHLIREGQRTRDGDVGRAAYAAHYLASAQEDVERFIEETVLGDNDPLAEKRDAFFNRYLLPPNDKTAAQNVMDEIETGLRLRK